MTNFRFKHYIAENDLTVMPRTFTRYLYEELLKDELNKYNISIIRDRNVDNITKICGKRIDIKYNKNYPNRFLYAKYNRSHISKSIKID